MELKQHELKSRLHYDPSTGIFTWLSNARKDLRGKRAGTVNDQGRRHIGIKGKIYKEHRLAWLYVHGYMPVGEIDHIDRNQANNKISNLREVTRSQNLYNRPKPNRGNSPCKCVSYEPRGNKWVSYGSLNGRRVYLGSFSDLELADLVSQEFRDKHHGEFACKD